jgi:hypothetical protein
MKHDYTMQISVLDLEKAPVKIIFVICLVLFVCLYNGKILHLQQYDPQASSI